MTIQTLNSCSIVLQWTLISFMILSWGSFLNVVAYRLLYNVPFFGARSRCPHCNNVIAWYDLLPIFSWLFLKGTCRSCKQTISWLYPCIEASTYAIFLTLFVFTKPHYWFSYSILFSALIVTLRTDLEEMIILRPFSLGLIPCGLLFSLFGLLPISPVQSLLGAVCGFFLLASIRHSYFYWTGHHGMGNGDPELLAGIGAFLGPLGCWITLCIGSLIGSLIGCLLFLKLGSKARTIPLPFGPFLVIGASITVIFYQQIVLFFAFM